MKMKRTKPTEHTATGHYDTFELEVAPGHTVTRVDFTSRLGAGRKGRAAEVNIHRTLTCTCGSHTSFVAGNVGEDLALLRHFDSPEERARIEAEEEAKKQSILAKLGLNKEAS